MEDYRNICILALGSLDRDEPDNYYPTGEIIARALQQHPERVADANFVRYMIITLVMLSGNLVETRVMENEELSYALNAEGLEVYDNLVDQMPVVIGEANIVPAQHGDAPVVLPRALRELNVWYGRRLAILSSDERQRGPPWKYDPATGTWFQ